MEAEENEETYPRPQNGSDRTKQVHQSFPRYVDLAGEASFGIREVPLGKTAQGKCMP